jgi:hypothetical protein
LNLVHLQRMSKARAPTRKVARLCSRPGIVVVMAGSATHWGQASLRVRDGTEDPLLLECVPAVALELRVLNTDGRPVGGTEITLVYEANATWQGMLGVSLRDWESWAPVRLDAISRLPPESAFGRSPSGTTATSRSERIPDLPGRNCS